MTAKDYLWRLRNAEREIKRLEEEYNQVRAEIESVRGMNYTPDRVTNARVIDLSAAIVKLEKYAERVNAKWDELIDLRNEAVQTIERLRSWRDQEILKRRYIHGQSWEQIAVVLSYDYRYVLKLHGVALLHFDEELKKDI